METCLSSNQFEKLVENCEFPTLESLSIDENLWAKCRSFAKELFDQGLVDPVGLMFSFFKELYSQEVTFRCFVRWFFGDEKNQKDFPSSPNGKFPFKAKENVDESTKNFSFTECKEIEHLKSFDQIWFFFCISIRISNPKYSSPAEMTVVSHELPRRLSKVQKNNRSKIYAFFALTPAGLYSNQLYLSKAGRLTKIESNENPFARSQSMKNETPTAEHFQIWFQDFLSLQKSNNSVILFDPRTTILPVDFIKNNENGSIRWMTIAKDVYLSNIVNPFLTMFDKRWSEANLVEKMHLKPLTNLQRTIDTLWFCLRTLKRNDEISDLFKKTPIWRIEDEKYFQSLRLPSPMSIVNKIKKKKRPLVKTVNKVKYSPLKNDSSREDIFNQLFVRQISTGTASKLLGGIKLAYFRYCQSYKSDFNSLNGSHLSNFDDFLQSKSTVEWLKQLKRIHFSPCLQQTFLREVYRITGFTMRNRPKISYGPNQLGLARSCDQQSPTVFWKVFQSIHDLQFPDESIPTEKQWKIDFQQYLIDEQLHYKQATLWTVDVFEFALTKNCTVLQLPEWNETRPLNATAKVTIIFAFSSDGQSTEVHFVFPKSLKKDENDSSDDSSYNEFGHLTSEIFEDWLKRKFFLRIKEIRSSNEKPIVLILCSRLPLLSASALSSLRENQIYPFGYPFTRTLPFRYMFERRVRNNRSTNMISELWKRIMLDRWRTHLLKGVDCTVNNIKMNFQQIWPFLINEKRNDLDDEDEIDSEKSFKEKARKSFEQANIYLSIDDPTKLVEQLRFLSTMIERIKKFLKIKPEENSYPDSSSDSFISSLTSNSSTDKRFHDENDEPRASKRLRSSSFCRSTETVSYSTGWIPPTNQQIDRIKSRSSSNFHFILLLVETIFKSTTLQLTDEQYRWLHSTATNYHQNDDNHKLEILIETASHVLQSNLVR